ncbi:amidohydrolase [Aspergillus stella-maris]|uniref:amidohydrolase n=1 Tax=Aspergillus stella-maris TaxID=1810926 RepID=UPI003CCDCCF2
MSTSTLFLHATIITVNPNREVINDGYILVQGGRIAALGKCPPPETLTISTSDSEQNAKFEIIDCTGSILCPGLINTHAHLVQSLLRGLAEDIPLHNWLCDAIWPLESVYEGEDGCNAARLTIAEMLKTGTTCFLDPMVTFRAGWSGVCKAVEEMRVRGCLGKLVKFPETNRQLSITDPRDRDLINMSIPALVSAHEEYHGLYNDRLHVWAAAGTPRGAPMSLYQELGKACADHGISITMHCAEAPRDREIYHDVYGCSAMEFIRDAKLCGQPSTPSTGNSKDEEPTHGTQSHNLVLAHMVNLDLETDLPLLSSTRTAVAHNPSSNLKLASGVAPIPPMLASSSMTVSLGTDGAPCSNHYDMIREMHLTSTLHKGLNHDASLIPAETALEMATINGARALGLDHEIGSLEVGKKADLILIDPYGRGGIGAAPWDWSQEGKGGVTAVTTVVHGCSGRDVSLVMVDGEVLVRDGVLVNGGREKEMEIVRSAQGAARGIRERCREGGNLVEGKLKCGWLSV